MREARLSSTTLNKIADMRLSAAYSIELADAILLGGDQQRHNAQPLLPNALVSLHARVEALMAALHTEDSKEHP